VLAGRQQIEDGRYLRAVPDSRSPMHPTGIGDQETCADAQQRGLAAAVLSHDSGDLALAQHQSSPVQYQPLAEALDDACCFQDHVLVHPGPSP
jgi:hypothetical protein